MASSLDFISHILQGAITLIEGSSAAIVPSKRTWSFPFPVHPWQIYLAPSLCAISTNFLAIIGLARAVPSKYLPSYLTSDFIAAYSCCNKLFS